MRMSSRSKARAKELDHLRLARMGSGKGVNPQSVAGELLDYGLSNAI